MVALVPDETGSLRYVLSRGPGFVQLKEPIKPGANILFIPLK